MANHKSALKRIKQTKIKTQRNKFYRTRLKNITKDLREAVAAGDKEKAQNAFLVVNKEFHSFVSKRFLKKNSAARRVSRLNKLINTLA